MFCVVGLCAVQLTPDRGIKRNERCDFKYDIATEENLRQRTLPICVERALICKLLTSYARRRGLFSKLANKL